MSLLYNGINSSGVVGLLPDTTGLRNENRKYTVVTFLTNRSEIVVITKSRASVCLTLVSTKIAKAMLFIKFINFYIKQKSGSSGLEKKVAHHCFS